MNVNKKRAFSALATVALLTFAMFGIVALTAVPVSAALKLTLSGPTTGNVGERLTFTVKAEDCRVVMPENRESCSDWSAGYGVTFRFMNVATPGTISVQPATTNAQGAASTSISFSNPATIQVSVSAAGGAVVSNTVQVIITGAEGTSPSPNPTGASPTATDGNGQSTAAPLLSEEGIADIAAQAETATGLGSNWLLIVLAFVIIVILAIIATALLTRRRD